MTLVPTGSASPRTPAGPELVTLTVRTGSARRLLTFPARLSVREALDTTELRVRAACGGVGSCGTCLVRLLGGAANPPTASELQRLDPAERAAGLRLSCQLRLAGDAEIELEQPAPPSRWRSIPEAELPSVEEGLPGPAGPAYGVAVDLGTTHIRISLWERRLRRRLATRWGPNPQAAWGSDVLNRLAGARARPQRGRELAWLVRAAILQALRDMLARELGDAAAGLGEVGRLAVVGNTAMLALLTERGGDSLLDPDHWERPVDYLPRDPEAWRTLWQLPEAELLLPAPLGGFVGSDLLASVVGTSLVQGAPGSLLLDVGTNTELALWDGQVLHVTSVPGGPAFEGGGSRFGMAAEPGAIHRVFRRSDGAGYACDTLGGAEVRGFCGSGVVDAVALLLEDRILLPSGRFAAPPGPGGYLLDPGAARSGLLGTDVDAFQRAKAATAAAMECLLARAGLGWRDLRRLCVCGAFGKSLDVPGAQAVGLLPPLAPGSVELHANATLAGCERVLLAPAGAALLAGVAGLAKVTNLSLIEGWEDRFIAHLRLAGIPPEALRMEVP